METHKAALNNITYFYLHNIIYPNKGKSVGHMKKAITIFPNLIRYQNNEPPRNYMKVVQAFKLLEIT